MRTRIKICGITRLEDALAAVELGADALGFIFHPGSPRSVDAARTATIVERLPPFVTSVGLFVDARGAFIDEVLGTVPLDLLQVHGDECPDDCEGHGRPYIKAVPMATGVSVEGYTATYPGARGFVLDSHGLGRTGGSGQRFDWGRFPRRQERPMILAGGLEPSNVAEAVRRTRAYGVDVSSGVEREPGVKDAAKMAAFIDEVRCGDSE
jgi:phosphoribosylanthranilate isomerase